MALYKEGINTTTPKRNPLVLADGNGATDAAHGEAAVVSLIEPQSSANLFSTD